MHGESFFFQAFVYLAAAVIAVPLAKRLGLGSVLGYLLAGDRDRPLRRWAWSATRARTSCTSPSSAWCMMLFVVGLELQPPLLWRMRGPDPGPRRAAGRGDDCPRRRHRAGARSRVAGGAGDRPDPRALVDRDRPADAGEKGLLRTDGGQASFAVLLFQDIAVIPMLAHPAAAAVGGAHGAGRAAHGAEATHGRGPRRLAARSSALGRDARRAGRRRRRRRSPAASWCGPSFRFVARTRLRETFTAAALLLVIGIALLMTRVGL